MTNSPAKVGGYYDVPGRSAVADVSARTTRDGYAITATFIRLDVAEGADEWTWTVRSTYPANDLARDRWAVEPAALARGPIHLQPNMGTDLSVDELLARSASKARSCASDEDRQLRVRARPRRRIRQRCQKYPATPSLGRDHRSTP